MSIKKNTPESTLTTLLKKTGFFLPITEKEVEEYDKIFGKTDIILPQEIETPEWLYKQLETSNETSISKIGKPDLAKVVSIKTETEVKSKVPASKNDYFKKLVLAAEVTDQLHTEPTFGHVKFVKILYLCEEACNMELSTNYVKHVAGPFDPKYMYTAIAQFKSRGWFNEAKRNNSYGFNFTRGENADEFKKYYPKYFNHQMPSISRIIELLRKKKSGFCEIVATLYFLWKEALVNNSNIDDDGLIIRFYSWGKEKYKFSEPEVKDALIWMRAEQIFPRLCRTIF